MRVDSKQSRRIRLGNEHTCIYDLLNKRIQERCITVARVRAAVGAGRAAVAAHVGPFAPLHVPDRGTAWPARPGTRRSERRQPTEPRVSIAQRVPR